jgi:hypothetical protein
MAAWSTLVFVSTTPEIFSLGMVIRRGQLLDHIYQIMTDNHRAFGPDGKTAIASYHRLMLI